MKEIKGTFDGPRAVTWEEGRIVAGFFVSAEKIDKVESRKLVFDADGENCGIACWETAALRSTMAQVAVGDYIVIQCNGKTKFKNGRGWTFTVSKPESGSETEQCVKKYGPTMRKMKEALESNRPQDVPRV